MAKKKLMNILTLILTLLVSVAVGLGIANGVLAVPYIGATANMVIGYAVVTLAVVDVVKKFL